MSDKLNIKKFTRTRGTWLMLIVLACAWIATSVWAFRVAGTSGFSSAGSLVDDITGIVVGSENEPNINDTESGNPEFDNNVVDEARQMAELRLLDAFELQEEKAAEAAQLLISRQQAAEKAKRLAEELTAEEAQRLAEQQAAEEAQQVAEQQAAEQAQRLAEKQADEEAQRLAEQQAAENAKRLAEEQAAEEAQRLAEQQAAEAAQRLAEQQAAEQAQRLAEKQANEEAQRLAEQQAAEEAQRLAEQQAIEEAQRLAEQQGAEEAQQVAEQQAVEQPKPPLEVSLVELDGEKVSLIGLLGEKEHLRRVSVGDWHQRRQQKISDQKLSLVVERQRSRDLRFLEALSGFLRFENRSEVVGRDIEQVLERMLDPLFRHEESMAVVAVSSNEFKGLADNRRLSVERGRAIVSYFTRREVDASRFMIEVEQPAGLQYGTHRVRVSIKELENDG